MAFMQLQSEFGRWYLVETQNGTEVIPADVVGSLGLAVGERKTADACTPEDWAAMSAAVRNYCEGSMTGAGSIELVEKWGARYSASGYMDCTDWVLSDTQAAAEAECKAMYGDDEPEEDEDDDTDDDLPDPSESEPTEPEEGDYTTSDHRTVYQYGKPVLTVEEDECFEMKLRCHADEAKFWPDCWFISDHGNAHRIDYSERKAGE